MVKQEQNLIEVTSLDEHYCGPRKFNETISFGQTFELMRNTFILPEVRMKGSQTDFEVLGFNNFEVVKAMKKITSIANTKTDRNSDARFEYQRELAKVFSYLNDGLEGKFIAILRAGDLVAQFYPQIRRDDIFRIEAKRLLMKNGEMVLGLIGNLPIEKFQGEQILIGEGCIATGLTVAGILELLAEEKVRPKLVRVDAAAVSQLGGEYLLNLANKLEIPLKIRAGILVFVMDERFYLRRTPEEGYPERNYTVGDAGDWSVPLFPDYIEWGAWWNRGRNTP